MEKSIEPLLPTQMPEFSAPPSHTTPVSSHRECFGDPTNTFGIPPLSSVLTGRRKAEGEMGEDLRARSAWESPREET